MPKATEERWQPYKPMPDEVSPFGLTVDGLHDYRGVQLSGLTKIDELSVRGCDFSGSNLQHLRITNCLFRDCIFDRANMVLAHIRSTKFIKCRFRKTDLRMAQIGIAGSIFDQCVFEGVRLTRAGFSNPVFQGVVFHGRDWERIDFGPSGLWNCAFMGDLRGITFRGDYQFSMLKEIGGQPKQTGLHNVSFKEAELFWVGIANGCVVENIVLPKSGSAFLCKTQDLLSWEGRLKSAFALEKIRGIERYFDIMRAHAQSQLENIVSRNDIIRVLGRERGIEVYSALKNFALM